LLLVAFLLVNAPNCHLSLVRASVVQGDAVNCNILSLMKKVCLLQLLLEMIYTIYTLEMIYTQRVSSSSCSIPKSCKCSFCAKAYHERDHCPARDAICYSCINP